jgi:coproporphyrinogen III oxidase-like Fe-S oxidoreductase
MQPGHTTVEKIIMYAARKKNASCLQFSPSSSLSVPRSTDNIPILLYLHVPFCEELCPYCSFNRVEFEEGRARSYFDALRKEIFLYRDLGYNFRAVYVGGGTPTILMDELYSSLRLIKDIYDIAEISVETNPNHLTKENIQTLKEVGINRLSVGVQTFDDNLLRSLNRFHKYGSGFEIADRLRMTQGIFHTLNVDMISNFPGQTMEMLENDLSTIISLGVDQVTYYPLMASSNTQETMRREFGSTAGGRDRDYYLRVIKSLSPHYKASTAWCFSRNDSLIDEYAVNYDEYAGLGSGAIGHLGGSAYANTFDIEAYIEMINKGELPVAAKKDFSLRDRVRYDFLMKLFGLSLDIASLNAKHGVNVYRYLRPEIIFFRLVDGLRKKGNILTLTESGQYYWFIMMREFFVSVNNFRDYCRAQIDVKEPAGNKETLQ